MLPSIIYYALGLTDASIPILTTNTNESHCYYRIFGLRPDASFRDNKQSAQDLMKLYNPDKGHSDTGNFMQVPEALLALTELVPQAEDHCTRQMIVAPKTRTLRT